MELLDCDQNFSESKNDSSYTNFYIQNFRDTVYFQNAPCIEQIQLTSPLTFLRINYGGYAEGFLRVFEKKENFFSYTDALYSVGKLVFGTYIEYYKSGKLSCTGQFEHGVKSGTWIWFYEDSKIQRVVSYIESEPITIHEYDNNGVEINFYDFFEEMK